MEKKEKDTIEETKDTEIVELKDKDLATISAGAEKGRYPPPAPRTR